MIRFYNTLSRRIEPFEPLEEGKVGLYTCGPTVYDVAHIGNFRTFLWEDLLKRFLRWEGFEVRHVKNLTDIDDKTISRAAEERIPVSELTQRYTDAFFEDLETLNCQPADLFPRATEHIPDMLALVGELEAKGLTYVSQGSVYFRIAGLPEYGCLCTVDLDGNLDGARIDSDEYEKESARDFVLWKAAKEGEPSWDSPWGKGRPGWHLECSAMSRKYLGEVFDIHTGGVDLVFPHHENEIAQSRGASGKAPVRYWLHAEHLLVEGEKMSKSKGNFHTPRDLYDRGVDPMSLRYLLLSMSYRKQLNFTFDGLDAAKAALGRVRDFTVRLKDKTLTSGVNPELKGILEGHAHAFREALRDDLNTAAALAALFDAIRAANTAMDAGELTEDAHEEAGTLINAFTDVFGVPAWETVLIPSEIEVLIEKRQQARKKKDFAEADRIRAELKSRGILLEDTPQGVRWKKA